jgi:peptide methionine sulfoxide reductase MsrB
MSNVREFLRNSADSYGIWRHKMEKHLYKVKVSFETEFTVEGELNEETKETIFDCLIDDACDYLSNADIKFEEIK